MGTDKPGFRPEFVPLTYLAKILSDIEEEGIVCVCVYVCALLCLDRGLSRIKTEYVCVHAWPESNSVPQSLLFCFL